MTERRALTPISEALRSYFRKAGMVRRLDLADAVDRWADAVGPQVAAVTRADSVTPDGQLRVRVVSNAWAHELSLMAPRILTRLNGSRQGRIREIRWLVGPLDRTQP